MSPKGLLNATRPRHTSGLFFFFNDTATTEIYTLFPTRRSSDLLAEEYRVAGNSALFEQLKQMLSNEPDRPSQAKIAQELRMNENAVKQAFHRLRQRYRLLLREEIAQTVAVAGDVGEELRHFISGEQTGLLTR